MVAKKKQEVLGNRDAVLTDAKGHGPRMPGQATTAQDPHRMQEYTMISSTRGAKRQLTMDEIIFSLKHYWRFVESEALELSKYFHRESTGKPHELKPNSEIG
jgi:hypothetical protein